MGNPVISCHCLCKGVCLCLDMNIFMILLLITILTVDAICIFCAIPILKSNIFNSKIILTDLSEHPNVHVSKAEGVTALRTRSASDLFATTLSCVSRIPGRGDDKIHAARGGEELPLPPRDRGVQSHLMIKLMSG